jgi:hypothetical protein
MVRFPASLLAVIAAFLLAPSAVAQFGPIFGNEPPPRPPASVPSRPDLPPPQAIPPGAPPNQVRPRDDVRSQPLLPPPAANQAPPGSRPQVPTAQTPSAQAPQANTATPPPGDEAVPEPPTPKIANPTAIFSGLDKITGRIITFDVAIDETVRFGALEVTPRVCYTRPPTELPQTDGFVEVDEVTLQGELRRIFTGWMFAASPGLNAVEHPIYDIWLADCKGGAPPAASPEASPFESGPPQRTQPRQQSRPPARTQAQPPSLPLPR